eukprot:scaffold40130_cov49-Phaeocystis_antarctica.AAC.1
MQHPSASPMTAYLNPQIRNSPVNSSLRLRPPHTTLISRGCRDRKTTGARAQGEDRAGPHSHSDVLFYALGSRALVTWLTPPQPAPALLTARAEDGGNEMVTREYYSKRGEARLTRP